MTKTNKTLLCVLLALVMTFALALTALTVADTQTAKAEGETLVATFDFTDLDVSDNTAVESIKTVAGEYTISATTTKVYVATGNKLKLGSGSANGSMSFTVADGISRIEIDAEVHNKDTGSLKVSLGSTVVSTTANTASPATISVDIGTEKSITIATTAKRWYVTAIRYYTAGSSTGGETTNAVGFSLNGTKLAISDFEADTTEHSLTYTSKESDTFNGTFSITNTTEGATGVVFNKGDTYDFMFLASVTEEQYTVKINDVVIDGGVLENGTIGADVTELAISIVLNCDHSETTKTAVSNGDGTHKLVCDTCKQEVESSVACTVEKIDGTAATCTTAGVADSWKCTECGTLFDSAEKTNVIEAATVIPALGHEYVNGTCTRCGAEEPKEADYTISVPDSMSGSYSNNKEFVLDSGITFTAYQVCKQGALQFQSGKGYIILKDLKISKIKLTVTQGTFAVYETTYPNVATGSALTADEGEAYTYSFDGTQARALQIKVTNGTGKITKIEIWTAPEVPASKFEVSQSIAAGDGAKEVTDETSGAKTIYVKNGSQIVVTYAITANDGINTFIATLKYNKALFSIVSVTITDGFGAGTAVKSGNVGVTDYKVYIEGDGEGYTSNYKGEFVTVVYQFNGDATATIDASEFGLMDVTCYTNHASSFVNADTKIGTSAETFDFIKQASITVEKTSFVYNGKAITAIGKGEHDQIKVTADGEGAISYKWYTDGTYATEVGEGYEVKNAGNYYLKLIVATTAAFESSELKVEITITPFDLKNADSEIVITANDKQVTGSALTWTVAELTINGGNLATARGHDSDENIFTATIAEHSLTNVGETQNVAVTLALNANYTYGGENSVAATVTLKVVAYANAWTTEPQNITKDFDNNKLTFAYAAEHGTPVYYLGGEVKTAEELANAIVNAGTYEVKIVVEVVGYSNLEKTITITINKLKIDASSMVFDYSEDGKIKWSNPTKAIGSTGAIDLPTAVKFTYTLVDGKTENYGEDAVLEYLAQAEGAYTLNVIPGDAVNYEGTSTTTKTVYTITFAEGTHDGDNVIEGVAAYATVYRFAGQNVPAAPAAPVLAGYRFDGWTNSDMFGVAVTASVTLTAQWVKTYVIAWNNDNGSALESKTVDAGTQIAYSLETAPTSVLGTDDYYTYTFAGWKEGEAVRELGYKFTVNGDITVTAQYTSTLAYVDVTYTLTYGNDTTATDTIAKVAIDTAVSAIEGLPELKAYTWFKNDGWKCGENAFTAATANLANEKVITIYATYVFAIGNGDVDGSGTVDTSDIVLYRKHIVGGYDITPVTDAWTTATAAGFEYVQGKFYLVAVANVDCDEAGKTDIRDVSTIRMALVGGYGYDVKDGAVVKGANANALNSARSAAPKQVLAPMGLFGKKFAL